MGIKGKKEKKMCGNSESEGKTAKGYFPTASSAHYILAFVPSLTPNVHSPPNPVDPASKVYLQ